MLNRPDLQIIPPDYQTLWLFCLGWLAGKGLDEEFKQAAAKQNIKVDTVWLIPSDCKVIK